MNIKNFLICSILIMATWLVASDVKAASFFTLPKSGEFGVGQTFGLEIRVNSEGQGFNAAQAAIKFPKDILEVKSVDFAPAYTIFNFWLEEPKVSNERGEITFIGGTTSGVVGNSIQILKVNFTVRGSGEDYITLTDAAITASDGSGTNILSSIVPALIKAKPSTTVAPERAVTPTETTPPSAVPSPVQITRTPIAAQKLPEKPKVTVPLYADSGKWYDITTDFLAQWELLSDISGVSTAINNSANYNPADRSEGLFDAKIFPALKDGVWYLHVKFQNNVGWGPVAHYRIAVDTVPPLPFTAESSADGLANTNPTPTIKFKTSDGLSGLRHYLVRVADGEAVTIEKDLFTLPLQPPGKKNVSVRAVDKAGNIRESSITLEILPIDSPTVRIENRDIFVGEGGLNLSGSTLPGAKILLAIKQKDGKPALNTEITAEEDGSWESRIDYPLKKGSYMIEIVAQDQRGASSLMVKSEIFKIKERPLLVLGGVGITQSWFFFGLFIILCLGFAGGWFSVLMAKEQRNRKIIIAQREIVAIFENTKNELTKVLEKLKAKSCNETTIEEAKFALNRMNDNLKRVGQYVLEDIKEINE